MKNLFTNLKIIDKRGKLEPLNIAKSKYSNFIKGICDMGYQIVLRRNPKNPERVDVYYKNSKKLY